MNPRDFLDTASRLSSSSSPTAADLRTSVSRAYYAAFNVALEFLRNAGVKPPDGWEGHRLVSEALQYSDDHEIRAGAAELTDLRKARWKADYEMDDTEVEYERTVRKLVARSRQMIRKLDNCSLDEVRRRDTSMKIRKWAQTADGSARGFIVPS